jgi:hypothetical protein
MRIKIFFASLPGFFNCRLLLKINICNYSGVYLFGAGVWVLGVRVNSYFEVLTDSHKNQTFGQNISFFLLFA